MALPAPAPSLTLRDLRGCETAIDDRIFIAPISPSAAPDAPLGVLRTKTNGKKSTESRDLYLRPAAAGGTSDGTHSPGRSRSASVWRAL